MLELRKIVSISAFAAILTVSATAWAAEKPEDSLNYRKKVMSSIGAHIGAIGDVLKGKVSHSNHVVGHARAMQAASLMLDDIFPPGSDVGDSRAKPEIWQQWDKFKAAIKAYQDASVILVQAAESGDMGAVGAAMDGVGKSCGGCHKPFRKPKE